MQWKSLCWKWVYWFSYSVQLSDQWLIFEGLLMKTQALSYHATSWQSPPHTEVLISSLVPHSWRGKEQLTITSWRNSPTWDPNKQKRDIIGEKMQWAEKTKIKHNINSLRNMRRCWIYETRMGCNKKRNIQGIMKGSWKRKIMPIGTNSL